jgi:tRNA (cmo5U34)-methyltransferase
MQQPDRNAQPAWQEADSQTFLDYGSSFVPDRDQQIETLSALIPSHFDTQPLTALDLCCGAGLLSKAILDRFTHSHVYGLDGSSTMLDQARSALAAYGDRFRTVHFDLAAQEWRHTLPPAQAIVSSLAIHHLDDEQKQHLFRDLFAMLAPGGVLAIADVVAPASAQGTAVAAAAWDRAVQRRARAIDGAEDAFEAFQRLQWNMYRYPDDADKPSRLSDQLQWLAQAGFQAVDVYWMQAGHAIFGGAKPR